MRPDVSRPRALRLVACCAALIVTSAGLAAPASAAAPLPGRLHAFATVDGIQLTIWMDSTSYVRNGLAVVNLKAINLTNHTVWMGPDCPLGLVWVSVRNTMGRPVYPPPDPNEGFPPETCTPTRFRDLTRVPPGLGVQRTRFVILAGRFVTAGVTLARVGSRSHRIMRYIRVSSPRLTVRLRPPLSQGPCGQFTRSGGRPSLRFCQTARPLWYRSEALCNPRPGIPPIHTESGRWRPAPNILVAPCDVERWVVVAGARNERTRVFSYP